MTDSEALTAEDLRLIGNIKWASADRDNMEFTTRVSCYQRDALNKLVALSALGTAPAVDADALEAAAKTLPRVWPGGFEDQRQKDDGSGWALPPWTPNDFARKVAGNVIAAYLAASPAPATAAEIRAAYGDEKLRAYSVAELLSELEREAGDAEDCDLENTANMFRACIAALRALSEGSANGK